MSTVNTRPSRRRRPGTAATTVAALVALGLIGTACGGSSTSVSPPTADVQETTAPTTTVEAVVTTVTTVATTVPATDAPTTTDEPAPAVTLTDDATDITLPPAVDYAGYEKLTDDSGTMTVEVPIEWSDVSTSAFETDASSYPQIQASMDIDAFNSTYSVPGMKFLSVPTAGGALDELLDIFSVSGCTDGGITDYDDGVFAGKYQLWGQCDGTTASYFVLATDLISGGDNSYVLIVQMVTSADLGALNQILATFNTIG
ncbi:MAG: hypothetical protein Q8K63_12960 [Acidimicrobiales bacterium]|nr:hypothetical protein [Acidimicrobiales bacterium]